MMRAYKFRLWTNANQERELASALETHRRLYNDALAQRKVAYQEHGVSISCFDQSRWLTLERKSHPFLSRLNAKSAAQTLRHLDKAFAAFFRRVKAGEAPGYPRFKSRDRFSGFTYVFGKGRADGARLIGNRLRLQNIGTLRVCLHRPVEGTIKTLTVKREADKWYLIVSCDLGSVQIPPSTNPPVGIDVGLKSFLTTSDGETVENPRFLKVELPELRRRQRSRCRKKRGGNNRQKAKRRVVRLHRRIANLRREHHHKTALVLVRRFGLIAVERLAVKNMVKNHRIAGAISDAGWASFVNILKCKAESAGVSVVEVDPRGTSQQCSACGGVVPKTLKDRWHSCHCGCSLDRDHNAARNVLSRALQVRTEPAGRKRGVAPVVPKSPA